MSIPDDLEGLRKKGSALDVVIWIALPPEFKGRGERCLLPMQSYFILPT
jgi:hypothetical protein